MLNTCRHSHPTVTPYVLAESCLCFSPTWIGAMQWCWGSPAPKPRPMHAPTMSMAFSKTPKWPQSNSISSYTARQEGSSADNVARSSGNTGWAGQHQPARAQRLNTVEDRREAEPTQWHGRLQRCTSVGSTTYPARARRGWAGAPPRAGSLSRRTPRQSRPSPPLQWGG